MVNLRLTEHEARQVRDLLDHHMASQANWMESALMAGDVPRATKLAVERDETRRIFAKINREIGVAMGWVQNEIP